MATDKIGYFATSLWKRLLGVDCACPNCGSKKFVVVDRKFIVTELRRCEDCRLIYRAPSDSKADNLSFYQQNYSQGTATDLPDDDELARLTAANFTTWAYTYDYYISLLASLGLGAGHRIFDYGCNWGAAGDWPRRDSM